MSAPVTIGVSLKMYLGNREAVAWASDVAAIVGSHPAVTSGTVDFFAIPGYLALVPCLETFAGSRARVGAQDLSTEDRGPFTGEVSGAELAEVGVTIAEVGHAERRRLFGEDDAVVAGKTRAALRNGLTPVLCVGEQEHSSPTEAAASALAQVRAALAGAPRGRVIVAYEPGWAIGADRAAEPGHVRVVTRALRAELRALEGRSGSVVIYGGSAGPGVLSGLWPDVDGLFLGRFAHDPTALHRVLDEAASLAASGDAEDSAHARGRGSVSTAP
jgi:triosephosphate isomerase